MTDATADHERDPLPLGLIGWGVTLTMFVFGAFGYLMRGDVFASEKLETSAAGWILLAVLSGIMQAGAAFGAKSLRRARNFKLDASKVLSGVMVGAGAIVTGVAIHNALTVAGMDPLSSFLIAAGVPVFEFSIWWVDESLRSEAETRRQADADRRAEEARNLDRNPASAPASPLGFDPTSFDYISATDEALEQVISTAASIKKRAENARSERRSSQKVSGL